MTQSATQDTTSIHAAVRDIIVQELEIEPAELTGDASFEEEYEADSLALLAVVARFERELDIVIPSDEVGRMTSLDNVFTLIAERGAKENGTFAGA